MEYLAKNKGKWLTSKEIAKGTKASIGTTTTSLSKLRKFNLVIYQRAREPHSDSGVCPYIYQHKGG